MGRGLSRLQNSILEIARARHPDPVYYAQLLVEITHWEPAKPPDSQSGQYKGGQNFDRRRIGLREYGIVRASLSRALRRLEIRGLIIAERGVTKSGRIRLTGN